MARKSGRQRGVAFRGRSAIAVALAAILVVTTSVTWRRARGHATAVRLDSLSALHAELAAQRSRREGEVRRAASQVELVPRVQRLGMRFPSDSQVIDLIEPRR